MPSEAKLLPNRAVVMAGGRGRRLGPYTWVLPKPLMPVGDMPVLELLLRQLAYFQITKVTLAVGYRAEYIRAFVGDGAKYGLDVQYVQEAQPLGTAGPLALIDDLDGTFLVMNGDLLTSLNFRRLIEYHLAHGAAATIATYRRTLEVSLGVLQTDGDQRVTGWIEKPTYDFQVSMGINVLEPGLLRYVKPGAYLDLPDLIKCAITEGEKIVAFPFTDGYWLDIGRPEDYEQALREIDALMPALLPGWVPPMA
ncbi:MAG: sugar phosphate nucleotidyltransferase [Aggregatilineales bacterium]